MADKDALLTVVLDKLTEGWSLRRISRECPGVPAESTLRDWFRETDDLSAQYTRARDEGFHARAEAISRLAATHCADMVELGSLRLRVDTEKWLLSKQGHKYYGDKLDVTSDGKAVSYVIAMPSSDPEP